MQDSIIKAAIEIKHFFSYLNTLYKNLRRFITLHTRKWELFVCYITIIYFSHLNIECAYQLVSQSFRTHSFSLPTIIGVLG